MCVSRIETQREISRKSGGGLTWVVCFPSCGCTEDDVVSVHVLGSTHTNCVCLASPLAHCVETIEAAGLENCIENLHTKRIVMRNLGDDL